MSIEHIIKLTEKSDAALTYGAALTGLTEADAVNKAIQAWVALVEHQQAGGAIALIGPDGDTADRFTLDTR